MLENGKVRSSRRNRKASGPRSDHVPSPAIPPRRTKNLDRRTREYLTPAEVEKLLQARYTELSPERFKGFWKISLSFVPPGLELGHRRRHQSNRWHALRV
jgi:hypothetical protein